MTVRLQQLQQHQQAADPRREVLVWYASVEQMELLGVESEVGVLHVPAPPWQQARGGAGAQGCERRWSREEEAKVRHQLASFVDPPCRRRGGGDGMLLDEDRHVRGLSPAAAAADDAHTRRDDDDDAHTRRDDDDDAHTRRIPTRARTRAQIDTERVLSAEELARDDERERVLSAEDFARDDETHACCYTSDGGIPLDLTMKVCVCVCSS